jgi:hypothetical protein
MTTSPNYTLKTNLLQLNAAQKQEIMASTDTYKIKTALLQSKLQSLLV